jgi:NAD-dependent deacetylase
MVVLTGAGISAESGLRTFRDGGGLWENHRVEDVATPEAFKKDPRLVWRFYKERWRQSLQAEPNAGHKALVELEGFLGDGFSLVTQNVDNLHRRAGSQRLIEMHGNLNQCFCTHCASRYELSRLDLDPPLPLCAECGEPLRPDIVWFGEIPYQLARIEKLIKACDLFLMVGTSGVVYPAAGFVMTAKYFGARTLAVNLDHTSNRGYVDDFRYGKAGEILPSLVGEWIG